MFNLCSERLSRICIQVTKELGEGALIQNFVVKMNLYQNFLVSYVTNGDDEVSKEQATAFFKNSDVMGIATETRKYVKLREHIFFVRVKINMEDFRRYLSDNYGHDKLRRPQTSKEYTLFQKKFNNYCHVAYCGEFGMWKVEINDGK